MNFLRGRVRDDGLAIETADVVLDTPALREHRGREVVAGIRPEDLHRIDPNAAGQGTRLEATIELVEAIGNEAYLHARCGSWPVVARTAPSNLPNIGDRIRLRPDPQRMHFFDAADGRRVEPK
jgi:multiple sugar transport system ATP-binding protein